MSAASSFGRPPRTEIEPDATKRAGVKPYAINPGTAKALWAESEEMAGERF